MIVVSNTSPITNLAAVGQLGLLPALFGRVLIPNAVAAELVSGGLHVAGTPWLDVIPVADHDAVRALMVELHAGEAEAITLASERRADLLLMDELAARRIASLSGLTSTGILGVLLDAKHNGLIAAVRPTLDALVQDAGFWVGRPLYEAYLRLAEE